MECVAQRILLDEEDLQVLLSECFKVYKSDRPARLSSGCFILFDNLAITSID